MRKRAAVKEWRSQPTDSVKPKQRVFSTLRPGHALSVAPGLLEETHGAICTSNKNSTPIHNPISPWDPPLLSQRDRPTSHLWFASLDIPSLPAECPPPVVCRLLLLLFLGATITVPASDNNPKDPSIVLFDSVVHATPCQRRARPSEYRHTCTEIVASRPKHYCKYDGAISLSSRCRAIH